METNTIDTLIVNKTGMGNSIKDDTRKIIQLAIRAPSGDNTQPWRFRVSENTIEIYNAPERAGASLYDFKQNPSLVALGAVIENMVIAAPHFGYDTNVKLFPSPDDKLHVANIRLSPLGGPYDDPFFQCIDKRAARRGKYTAGSLSPEQVEYIKNVSEEIKDDVRIELIEDKERKKLLARAIVLHDRVLFHNRSMHDFLFKHIRWTKRAEREKKDGIYAGALGLTPFQYIGMFFLKIPFVSWLLSRTRIIKLALIQNAGVYESSSGIGAIIIKKGEKGNFVRAGRALESIWLYATKMDLAMQPLGFVFLFQRLSAGEVSGFSAMEQRLLKKSCMKIYEVIPTEENETIAMMFRIGKGTRPPFHSARMEPEIEYVG